MVGYREQAVVAPREIIIIAKSILFIAVTPLFCAVMKRALQPRIEAVAYIPHFQPGVSAVFPFQSVNSVKSSRPSSATLMKTRPMYPLSSSIADKKD